MTRGADLYVVRTVRNEPRPRPRIGAARPGPTRADLHTALIHRPTKARDQRCPAPPARVPHAQEGNETLPVYLSIEEAAQLMSLPSQTIRRRMSDGTIPATNAAVATSASASRTSKQRSAASRRHGGEAFP